jgi:pimeloyl-ACP methyl ester carboxylesterase
MSTSTDGPQPFAGFEPGVAEIPAGRIHYREAGSGPTLVFVHGWAVNGTLWEQTATELSSSHRCIVVDWPFGSHPEPLAPEAARPGSSLTRSPHSTSTTSRSSPTTPAAP